MKNLHSRLQRHFAIAVTAVGIASAADAEVVTWNCVLVVLMCGIGQWRIMANIDHSKEKPSRFIPARVWEWTAVRARRWMRIKVT